MSVRFVSDSSSNLFALPGADHATVPLKIIFGDKEYVDQPGIDTGAMMEALARHKGPSGTSCPNVQEWLDAFGDADRVYAVAITSQLSGSYAAGAQAVRDYMEQHPGRQAYILDSRATGPAMVMMMEDALAAVEAGASHEEVIRVMEDSARHNRLLFLLQSMNNLARNGRCSPAVAKLASMLGIRLLGKAENGVIAPICKPRGEEASLRAILEQMEQEGYKGGKVRISHSLNLPLAEKLQGLILEKWPTAQFAIQPNSGLCCFYAERGGLLVSFSDL